MRWSEGDSAQDERGERGVAPQVAPSQRTGTSPHHTHTHSWRPNVCSGRHRPPHAPASSSQTQGQESSGMGGRQSTTAGTSRLSANNSPAHMYASTAGTAAGDGDEGRVRVTAVDVRPRTRSLSNVLTSSNGPSSSNGHHHHHQAHNHHPHHTHLHQPSLMSMAGLSFGLSSGSPDSDTSAEDMPSFGRVFSAHSLPVQPFLPFNGIKCPVCSKTILSDDVECHLVMCLTKPRIGYNEDVLKEQKGECVICLDEMNEGETIARLPCLCIYHKKCIDDWFQVNRSCPEHPAD